MYVVRGSIPCWEGDGLAVVLAVEAEAKDIFQSVLQPWWRATGVQGSNGLFQVFEKGGEEGWAGWCLRGEGLGNAAHERVKGRRV